MPLYKAFRQIIAADFDLDTFLPRVNTPALPDVSISQGSVLMPAAEATKIHRKGVQAQVGIQEKVVYLGWKGIANFAIRDGKFVDYQSFETDLGTLGIFTLSEALGVALFQQELFLLHGSAIGFGGQAHVFVGMPGAGKSTTATAFWQAGFPVLTDDLVAIQFIDNQPFVVPAFPSLKVWGDGLAGLGIDSSALTPAFEGRDKYLVEQAVGSFPQEPLPLAEITVLHRPYSRVAPGSVANVQVPLELLKHFPLPHQLLQGAALQRHFQQAVAISRHASVRRIRRPKNFAALRQFIKSYAP